MDYSSILDFTQSRSNVLALAILYSAPACVMEKTAQRRNSIIFSSLCNWCNNAGLVQHGCNIFCSIDLSYIWSMLYWIPLGPYWWSSTQWIWSLQQPKIQSYGVCRPRIRCHPQGQGWLLLMLPRWIFLRWSVVVKNKYFLFSLSDFIYLQWPLYKYWGKM